MFKFSDVVSLSTKTKQALNLVNACVELMQGVRDFEFFDEEVADDASGKEGVLDKLEDVLTDLRFELGVSVTGSLIKNPPKESVDTII